MKINPNEMSKIKRIDDFLKTDFSDQSSFFEGELSADDVDYHGRVINIKKEVEREQKKLIILTKVDQLNDMLRSMHGIIEDLNDVDVDTKGLQDLYYRLASMTKSLS